MDRLSSLDVICTICSVNASSAGVRSLPEGANCRPLQAKGHKQQQGESQAAKLPYLDRPATLQDIAEPQSPAETSNKEQEVRNSGTPLQDLAISHTLHVSCLTDNLS